jgi:putative hydrolase of the HAD superfamily
MGRRHDHLDQRGLLLDFGGVLTTSVLDAIRRFCAESGLEPSTLLDAFRTDPVARQLLVDIERGAIIQEEFEVGVGRLLGVDHHRLVERMLASCEPEPVVLEAAERARAAGVRTGVLSNSLGLHPYNPYADWGLAERFDVVVISEETGTRKPEPAIYRLAVERLGLPFQACVFVDDLAQNLEPARALGMTTVRKTSTARLLDELEGLLGIPLR